MKKLLFILFCFVSQIYFQKVEAAETTQGNLNNVMSNTNFLKSFALGQPTNDICAGILKKPQPDYYVCLLYVGQTNSSRIWIAPPRFQRGEYYLYDSSGKVIPYSKKYHPTDMIYKTITDVPKNVHGVRQGLMGPPFTMPYDQIDLTNVFQIKHGGDYKLVVKSRILKINNDSSLSVMEFPPVSLLIHIQE